MRRILILSYALFAVIGAYGQVKYDSLSTEVILGSNIKESPTYYDGQSVRMKVIFKYPHHYDIFYTDEEKILRIDTTYLEPDIVYTKKELRGVKKGIPLRQRLFRIDTLKSNLYKADLSAENKIGTPLNAIENKRFIIKKTDCERVYLEDSAKHVFWFDFNKNAGRYKLILEGYEEKFRKKILARVFYVEKPRLATDSPSTLLARTLDGATLKPLLGKLEVVNFKSEGETIFEYIVKNSKGEKFIIRKSCELLTDEDVAPYNGVNIFRNRTAIIDDLIDETAWVFNTSILKNVAAKEAAAKETRVRQSQELQDRPNKLMKKYGEKIAQKILNGRVEIGMTADMCIEAWGKPDRVNTTIIVGLKSEQWVYGITHFLYFENGVLTGIQY